MDYIATVYTTNHPTLSRETIVDLCGLLPGFIGNIGEEQDIVEGLTEQYGFGELMPLSGTIVDTIYVSPYAEDSKLKPLVQLKVATASIYIYFYGILAIVYDDDRDTFISRLD
jgi:hypothetical protein